jgi:hypothetical protein
MSVQPLVAVVLCSSFASCLISSFRASYRFDNWELMARSASVLPP